MTKLRYFFLLIVLLSHFFLLNGCDNVSDTSAPTAVATNYIGGPAPDFTSVTVGGEEISLSQYRGQVVILNFWATWCPPCREEMPSMQALHDKFAAKGLVLLAVNVEENGHAVVSDFLKKTPYSFPIVFDEDAVIQNTYKVFRFPETFIIDKNGVVVEKIIGGRDWMHGSVFKTIDFLLNG